VPLSSFWQLISEYKRDELHVHVYSNTSGTGTLIKNVTSYIDEATHKIKTVSESMAFVPNSGGGGHNGPVGMVFSAFNDVSAVAMSVVTPLFSFTAGSTGVTYLYRMEVGGTNAASYIVYINGIQVGQAYTPIAGPFDTFLDFAAGNSAGLLLNIGDVVTVSVVHSRPMLGDFFARMSYIIV